MKGTDKNISVLIIHLLTFTNFLYKNNFLFLNYMKDYNHFLKNQLTKIVCEKNDVSTIHIPGYIYDSFTV